MKIFKRLIFLTVVSFLIINFYGCDTHTQTYTITFETNEGNKISPIPFEAGTLIHLPITEKEGHIFKGWYLDEDFSLKFNNTIPLEEDTTLYAKWEIASYTITFETYSRNIFESISVQYGNEIPQLPIPNKTYFIFDGWYINSECTLSFNEHIMPSKDMILYAKWESKYSEGLEYTLSTNNRGYEITGYNGPYDIIYIPSTYNGKPVKKIRNEAFKDLDNIELILFDGNIKSLIIGTNAFANTSISTIDIPKNASFLFPVFNNTKTLTTINVHPDNEYVSSNDGILYNKNQTSLIRYPAGRTDSHYTIKEGVRSISELAFYGEEDIKSLTLPSTFTTLVMNPLSLLKNLEEINVHEDNLIYTSIDGVLIEKIDNILVRYPAGKQDSSYTIPDTIRTIKPYAFENATHLTNVTIPRNVKYIGAGAFNNTGMTSITIPSSIISIEDSFLSNTLSEINVSPYSTHYSSLNGVLYDKYKTTLLKYPPLKEDTTYTFPYTVTTISKQAFSDTTYLETIIIPDTVTTIENDAFLNTSAINIYVNNPVPPILNGFVTYTIDEDLKIFVPPMSVDAYKNAWDDHFSDHIFPNYEYAE